MILLLGVLVVFAVWLRYRFSDAFKSRESLKAVLLSAEVLQTQVEEHRATLNKAIRQASSFYVEEVHADRLRAIPLDALKEQATGLRLQALRDAGIHHLGDLQGWGESRIGQIRGVGPKSASVIASLVRSMSAAAKIAPVELPDSSLSRSRDRRLAGAILLDMTSESALKRTVETWASTVREKRNEGSGVGESLAFLPWLTGLGRSRQVREATSVAKMIVASLGDGSTARTVIKSAFTAAQAAPIAALDAATLLMTYQRAANDFDRAFATALNVPPRTRMSSETNSNESVNSAALTADTKPEQLPPSNGSAVLRTSLPTVASQETALRKVDDEKLASLVIADGCAASDGDVVISPPRRVEFTRLVKGPVPGLPRTPQTSAEILQTFLFAKQAQGNKHRKPQWIFAGQSIVVQGITIARGMLYTGAAISHGNLMGAVDPGLAISRNGSAEVNATVLHGSTYATFSPEQRYWFLRWLAEGAIDRSQPAAAMLHFQGLEHRLLAADVADEERAVDEAEVLAEVNRLAEVFHNAPLGPGHHARSLASFLKTKHAATAGMPSLPAAHERAYELPFSMRHGLGCFMRDKQPVPIEWMLRWVDLAPNIYLRTPATRCRATFDAAFTHLYRARYGDGLVIPANKTMLKVSYSPSDYNLRGPAAEWTFRDLPDINALTVPQGKLRELVDKSTEIIEPYSRFCGRNPGVEESLQACFLLPRTLWPETVAAKLASLRFEVAEHLKSLSLEELLARCGETGGAAGARLGELAGALEQNSIGMEPDVTCGARRPKGNDYVVLFVITEQGIERDEATYRKASLATSLAACVALADGQADQAELEAAERLIAGWQHLHVDLRMRLRAQYRFQVLQGAGLAALRAKLLALEQAERREIALDMTRMAAADGVVSPAEVKLLESLYRMLGLPGQELYGHLYGGADQKVSTAQNANGFALDLERVRLLQQESAAVSIMLDKVFTAEQDDVVDKTAPVVALMPQVVEDRTHGLLPGLDRAHEELLRHLLTRPQWQKSELVSFASGLKLMLDGGLERINDAAFEHLDAAIVEGDDPIFVLADLLEKA